MNNEIKEILECMEEIADCTFTTDIFELNFEDTKILLDYIINLQQENERLKDNLETMTFTAKIKQYAVDSLITKIDKAIEYIEGLIEEWENDEDEYFQGIVMEDKTILDLLKGEE